MTSHDLISLEGLSEYYVYKDDSGKNVLYDTGAQADLNSPEMIRAIFPDAVQLDRIRKYNPEEIVLISKEKISFLDALPLFSGVTYELPFLPMPAILQQLPMLKMMMGQMDKSQMLEMIKNMAEMFGIQIPDISEAQLDTMLGMLDTMGDVAFPIIELNVNGQSQKMLFDTGTPCQFTINSSLMKKATGTRKEWLAMEHKYAELETFEAEFSHPSGFAFSTKKLASLIGHQVYSQISTILECQGIMGMECLADYDICINKNESLIFIKR